MSPLLIAAGFIIVAALVAWAIIGMFCHHHRKSFPITRRGQGKGAYVVCLDCGKEFDYDWAHMRQIDG
jgi:predicted protein tyrosine phosphatase